MLLWLYKAMKAEFYFILLVIAYRNCVFVWDMNFMILYLLASELSSFGLHYTVRPGSTY